MKSAHILGGHAKIELVSGGLWRRPGVAAVARVVYVTEAFARPKHSGREHERVPVPNIFLSFALAVTARLKHGGLVRRNRQTKSCVHMPDVAVCAVQNPLQVHTRTLLGLIRRDTYS